MSERVLNIQTPLTDTFELRLPIVAGGLMWLANAQYVSAAARSGILGFITAASFPDDDDLRREIDLCRKLSNGAPFGVNVSMFPKLVAGDRTEAIFRLIIDSGIDVVETSGRNPEAYIPMLKEAGVRIIHKVPAVRYALKAQSIGVDMVSIVGAECGGHPGLDMIGSFVNSAMALEQLEIPFIIGGGIGHGAQLTAALSMGASGVVVGTRFLVAEEVWAHDRFKQRLIEANETDTSLIMSSIRNTVRALSNNTTREVQKLEQDNPEISVEQLMPLISGKVGLKAYETGNWEQGVLSAGHSMAFVHKVEALGNIVSNMEAEAVDAFERVGAFMNKAR